MIAQPYHLYIERTNASKNMARYYAMEISMTLFGEACLTRSWGRIGKRGQSMSHFFEREEDAVDLFLDLVRQKRSRGYRPAGAEGRESRFVDPTKAQLRDTRRRPKSISDAVLRDSAIWNG